MDWSRNDFDTNCTNLVLRSKTPQNKNPQPFPAGDLSNRNKIVFQLLASATRFQLLEEIVALVVDQNEGWEILNLNLPNGLHTEFGVLNALNALNVVLRQNGSGAAD